MSVNKEYFRVMLGKAGVYAAEGRANNWIGANWEFNFDLSEKLTLEREAFKRAMRPVSYTHLTLPTTPYV